MNTMKCRLVGMSFLQFAVWGAYLISMGGYLFNAGMGDKIGYFYAMQGVVSLFMPALMGIVADRWVPAQKLLAGCHLLSALCLAVVGYSAVLYHPGRRCSDAPPGQEEKRCEQGQVDRHRR